MRIKRFVAEDMRSAIKMVRDEQGPDAVILSNQQVAEGVEVIAAVDYDAKLMSDALALTSDQKRAREKIRTQKPPETTEAESHQAQSPAPTAERPRGLRAVLRQATRGAGTSADTPPAETPAAVQSHHAAATDAPHTSASTTATALASTDDTAAAQSTPEHRADWREQVSSELAFLPLEDDVLELSNPVAQALEQDEQDASPLPMNHWAAPEPGHEPALQEMRREVATLRRTMESQLSALMWHDEVRRDPHRAAVLRELARLGLSASLARKMAASMPNKLPGQGVARHVLTHLAEQLPIAHDEHIDEGGIIALVGPTGAGKTTSIAKLAARFAMRHGREKLALVTADNYRIGAHDQLLTFAQILSVPVRTASSSTELAKVLHELRDAKLVLIDTAGISQRDERLPEHLALLQQTAYPVRVLLTFAANTDALTMHEIAVKYGELNPVGCVLTKLDEAARLGNAISTLIEHRLPLAYATDGQRVPEDIHWAGSKKLNLIHRAAQLLVQTRDTVEDETMIMRQTRALAGA